MHTYQDLLSGFNGVKLFLLKGYSYANQEQDDQKRYKEAKTPVSTDGKRIEIEQQDIEKCLQENFWIGLEIPQGYVLVDIDDKQIGQVVADALKNNAIYNVTIKTPNGCQFLFKDNNRVKTQAVKTITPAGVVVDYRLSGKGYTILPTPNTQDRAITWLPSTIDNMPDIFIPVRTAKQDEQGALDIPVWEGSRNGTMISHAARVKAWNERYRLGLDERQILEDINIMFLNPPLTQQELNNIYQEAQRLPEVDAVVPACDQANELQEVLGLGYDPKIPFGFGLDAQNNLAIISKEKQYPVCQAFGIVAKVKPEEGREELGFYLKDTQGNEAFMSMNIADRKSFEKEITGFLERPLDSENVKLLQRYIAHYYRDNHESFIVRLGFNRTGWKDGKFYIPTRTYSNVAWLDDNLTNAYSCGGDRDQQITLLKEILKTPAACVVLAALASTLVKPFNIPNFIVYCTGLKGKGKSTSVSYAESLLGNPRYLKGTWFSTRVGKEGLLYMNTDMPIMIDELETLGSNLDEVINTIYQFESGFGKIRGRENLKTRKTKRLSGGLFITSEKDLDALVASVSGRRTVPLGLYRRVIELQVDEGFFTQHDTGGKFNLPAVNKFLLENYGWFGIDWFCWLENNQDSIREHYGLNLQATSQIGEMEGAFGAILTVADILLDMGLVNQMDHEMLKGRVIRIAVDHRDKNIQVEDIGYRFKRKLADYCTMNGRGFFGMEYDVARSIGLVGEVQDRDVFLLKTTFEKICQENGFVAAQVLKQLDKNGDLDAQRGHEKQKRVAGHRYWGYSIKNVFEPDEDVVPNELLAALTSLRS